MAEKKRECGHGGYVNGCLSCFAFLCDERDRLREALRKIQDALDEALGDEVL